MVGDLVRRVCGQLSPWHAPSRRRAHTCSCGAYKPRTSPYSFRGSERKGSHADGGSEATACR